MATTRNDDHPLLINDITHHISRFLDTTDLAHFKMSNKMTNSLFHPDILRKQLQHFSIKQIIRNNAELRNYLFLDNLGTVWECRLEVEGKKFCMYQITTLPKIKSIIQCDEGFIFLSQEGQVWVYGLNMYGDLGSNSSGWFDHYWKPVQLSNLPRITQVASCQNRSFFLDEAGKVWRCGIAWREDGEIETTEKPIQIQNLPVIRKVVPSDDKVVFIDHMGDVWCCHSVPFWSHNYNKDLNIPVKMSGISKIKDVYAVQSGLYLINNEGEVFLDYNVFSFKKLPDLTGIEYIISSYRTTFYVDMNKHVFITGGIVETVIGVDSSKKYATPVRIDKFDAIKNIVIPNSYFLKNFIICINQAGEVNFCRSDVIDENHYDALLKLNNNNNFNFIDNANIDFDIDIFIKKGGNIAIHEFKDGKSVSYTRLPFNFATQYHLDVIHRHGLDMKDLINFACQPGNENKIFFDACMSVLRSESDVIRFHYLMQLSQSPHFEINESVEILLFYPQYTYTRHFNFDEQKASLASLKTIINFYYYFNSKSDNDNGTLERSENFKGLIDKLNYCEINCIKDLADYFSKSEEQFTKRSLVFFSITRLSHEYADLREQFLKKMGDSENMFTTMKNALLFMHKAMMAYTGGHGVIKNIQLLFQENSLSNRPKA